MDWDAIASDDHAHILSPFAPAMAGRNPLLDELLAMPLERLDIADFGCGSGNLIPHFANRRARLVGVDASARSVALATEVAERHGLTLFADDGVHQQAYHSPESIAAELPRAGLRILRGPTKVRYPWSLTRRFDYGDVPDAPEEVWDWYVVAQSAA